jgi:hypothetical protein
MAVPFFPILLFSNQVKCITLTGTEKYASQAYAVNSSLLVSAGERTPTTGWIDHESAPWRKSLTAGSGDGSMHNKRAFFRRAVSKIGSHFPRTAPWRTCAVL